jgi:methylenetetrahydrofolate reductase (NADPH)
LIFAHLQNEAFSIWSEWASFHPPRSVERELLESVRDTRWLVSLLHHDYKDRDALWNFLLESEEDTSESGRGL